MVIVVAAYAVGWMGHAALGDPCVAVGTETDRVDHVERWLPPRTDCRVTTADGATRVEPGPSDVFWALFAFTLVAGFALVAAARLALRAVMLLAAAVAAFVVIFVF